MKCGRCEAEIIILHSVITLCQRTGQTTLGQIRASLAERGIRFTNPALAMNLKRYANNGTIGRKKIRSDGEIPFFVYYPTKRTRNTLERLVARLSGATASAETPLDVLLIAAAAFGNGDVRPLGASTETGSASENARSLLQMMNAARLTRTPREVQAFIFQEHFRRMRRDGDVSDLDMQILISAFLQLDSVDWAANSFVPFSLSPPTSNRDFVEARHPTDVEDSQFEMLQVDSPESVSPRKGRLQTRDHKSNSPGNKEGQETATRVYIDSLKGLEYWVEQQRAGVSDKLYAKEALKHWREGQLDPSYLRLLREPLPIPKRACGCGAQ